MRTKGCCIILAAVMLLAGCKSISMDEYVDTRTLTLVMQSTMSEYAKESATVFINKVSEISNGALKVQLIETDRALEVFDEGHDLFFASNEVMAEADGSFLSYTSPFYFSNYRHMTLTLNSEQFFSLTRETALNLLGAEALAAFYDGSQLFLTIRDETMNNPAELESLKIYIPDDPLLEYTLNRMGMETTVKTLEDRVDGFNTGYYLTIVCDSLFLENIVLPQRRERINVSQSFATAKINWMMLSAGTKADLSSYEKAVIDEALAYAIALGDRQLETKEENGIEHLKSIGAVITQPNYYEFFEKTDEILEESARYYNLWDWNQHRSIREIAPNYI